MEGEAERWLRILRLYGKAGSVLQALGVGEAPLSGPAEAEARNDRGHGPDVVEQVMERAIEHVRRREGPRLGTVELLHGVIDVYGVVFSRVLYRRGITIDELVARLEEPALTAEPEAADLDGAPLRAED